MLVLASDRLADAEYVSLINPEKCQLITAIRLAMPGVGNLFMLEGRINLAVIK
jgi:hypothetical protein